MPSKYVPNSDSKTPLEEKVELKRSFNVFYSCGVLISVVGNIAIFILPSIVIHHLGSIGSSLFFWIASSIVNLFLALCYAEMGIMFPKAGGHYVYTLYTFGDLAAFMMMWGYLFLLAAPYWVVLAYSSVLYLVRPFYPDCPPNEVVLKLLTCVVLVIIVGANCLYTKYIKKLQAFLSAIKLGTMGIIMMTGIVKAALGETGNFSNVFAGSSTDPGSYIMGGLMGIFGFAGWQQMLALIEEVKNPEKDIPRALYISFAVLTVCYFCTNLAYFIVLDPTEVAKSNAVAITFSEKISPILTTVVSICVAFSCFGSLNGAVLAHSRLAFAGARNGQLPYAFCMMSVKYCTPAPAVILLCVVALGILWSGTLNLLLECVSLFSGLVSLAVVICLLKLRWSEPHRTRPLKLPLWIPLSQLVICSAVLFITIYIQIERLIIPLVVFGLGFPVYILGVLWKNKPKIVNRFHDKFTRLVQICLNVVPDEKKD